LIATARQNMDQLPCGTAREKLVEARDAVIVPVVPRHERRKSAQYRADSFADLSTVYGIVADLDRKGEIDHADFNENWALAERLVKRIRPALADVILANPQLPDEEIKRQVERLVDRHIDGCLDSVPAGA
jgi:hypothetical protein